MNFRKRVIGNSSWSGGVLLAMLIVATFTGACQAQTLGEWEVDGYLPTPLRSHGMEAIDDGILVFGGMVGPYGPQDQVAATWLYQPGGIVEPRADMPAPLHDMATAVSNGDVFVMGGYIEGTGVWGRRRDVYSYNPTADAWIAETFLPFERAGAGGASLNGFLYCIGGHSETSRRSLADTDVYDPLVGGPWVPMAPMNQRRMQLETEEVDGLIYAIGGNFSPGTSQSIVEGWLEVYDPETNTWTFGPSMPTPRFDFASAVVGSRIYTIGGRIFTGVTPSDWSWVSTDTVEYLDTETMTWHADTPLPAPRSGMCATAIGNEIYVAGGISVWDEFHDEVFRASVTPDDAEPPVVDCMTDPASSWPPNHKMVDVNVAIMGSDDVTSYENLTLEGVFVASSEPDDGLGDGDTSGDVNGEDGFMTEVDVTDLFEYDETSGLWLGTIPLRAERAGFGDGRTYTITAFVSDEAGNIGATLCEVVVSANQGKAKGNGKK